MAWQSNKKFAFIYIGHDKLKRGLKIDRNEQIITYYIVISLDESSD